MSQSSPLQVELAARLFCYAILVLNLLQPVVPGRVRGAGLATAMKTLAALLKEEATKAGSVFGPTHRTHICTFIYTVSRKKNQDAWLQTLRFT